MSFVALFITLLLSSLPTFLKSVPSISKTSNTHVPISSAKNSLVRGDALSKSAGIEKGALVICFLSYIFSIQLFTYVVKFCRGHSCVGDRGPLGVVGGTDLPLFHRHLLGGSSFFASGVESAENGHINIRPKS